MINSSFSSLIKHIILIYGSISEPVSDEKPKRNALHIYKNTIILQSLAPLDLAKLFNLL